MRFPGRPTEHDPDRPIHTPEGRRKRTWVKLVAAAALVAGTAAAAVALADRGGDPPPEPEAAPAPATLLEACGPRLIMQTDWFPEPEHGHSYQLAPGGATDPERGTYTGAIGDTGVTLEIRAGGPYIGFQPQASVMAADDDIDLLYIDLSALAASPVAMRAVFSPYAKSPEAFMTPRSDTPVTSLADLEGRRLLTFPSPGAAWLIAEGHIDPSQVDEGFDGSPGYILSQEAGERLVVGGFATNEPWRWTHEVTEGAGGSWIMADPHVTLQHDLGWQDLKSVIAVRPEAEGGLTDGCLTLLVPLMQQAAVDYTASPDATTAALVDVVNELNTWWTATLEGYGWAVGQMAAVGVNHPPGAVAGSFAPIERIMAAMEAIATAEKWERDVAPVTSVWPVDGRYLDRSIRH